MSGALPRGSRTGSGRERKSTLLQLLRRRCVHRKISRRWRMKAGRNERGGGRGGGRRRRPRGVKEGKERNVKKKSKREREEGPTLSAGTSKVGEGAFSDEIRSRGRSEFGYLIRERGKGGWRGLKEREQDGGESVRAPLSLIPSPCIRLSFSRAASAANGITRIPHFKRRFIHPTSPPRAGTN